MDALSDCHQPHGAVLFSECSMPTSVPLDELFSSVENVSARDLQGARIHMLGIGGSGMAGLAAILLRRGARVSGSDRQESSVTRALTTEGARITLEHERVALPDPVDLVVVSAAIPPTHPELLRAQSRGVRVLKYAELLGVLLGCYEGIAVSGTHGKSTTTAWLAYTLQQAGRGPNYVIGADVAQLGGGSGVGDGPQFVVEACEYDRSFLNLHPRRTVVLNIDEDHLDCYPNRSAIEEAFAAFVGQNHPDGLVLIHADDAGCRRIRSASAAPVESFGLREEADWQATRLELRDGTYAFDVCHHQALLGRVHIQLAGQHNVLNALAVAALAHDCGVPWEAIASGLAGFTGAKRRLEWRAAVRDVTILDDYAHHPAEIQATLLAARERYKPRRLLCIFQPHQHSRTRFLLDDFSTSFDQADEVILPDIFFVRDSERDRHAVCSEDLVARVRGRGGNAVYIPEFERIVDYVYSRTEPGDVVLTMGAGNIWKLADALVQRAGGGLSE